MTDSSSEGQTIHVSPSGSDEQTGTAGSPLATITAAAERAQPGDRVLIHEGIYREWIDPPRGGEPDAPITFEAKAGATVDIRGSERVDGWTFEEGYCWSKTLDNRFFGDCNPFGDRIRGDWFDDCGRDHHRGAVFIGGQELPEASSLSELQEGETAGWFAEVGAGSTTIWATFGEVDLRDHPTEVTVRPAVFYPSEPGRDFITLRGLTLSRAATQWAPPTTEQIGLVGTHWSRGWVIENNEISHSRCVGLTLGKFGASVDDTGASAERFVDTIHEAIDHGWERENIGHHIVRNNHIHHCEQAGIAGSLGGAFSEVSGNHVHHINRYRRFEGAEIAGIKLHGAVDTAILNNHVHHTRRGIWVDWLAQGTRIARNLLYGNTLHDLFPEVNHGPFVVDHNILLSETAIRDRSQGGAYAHNLIAGDCNVSPVQDRETPYLEPHSTTVVDLSITQGGDDHFYNNVFIGGNGLADYADAARVVRMEGNVFLDEAVPGINEENPMTGDGRTSLTSEGDSRWLTIETDLDACGEDIAMVTSERLGEAAVSGCAFLAPDGTDLSLDRDYLDRPREGPECCPGPFTSLQPGTTREEVWPRK